MKKFDLVARYSLSRMMIFLMASILGLIIYFIFAFKAGIESSAILLTLLIFLFVNSVFFLIMYSYSEIKLKEAKWELSNDSLKLKNKTVHYENIDKIYKRSFIFYFYLEVFLKNGEKIKLYDETYEDIQRIIQDGNLEKYVKEQ